MGQERKQVLKEDGRGAGPGQGWGRKGQGRKERKRVSVDFFPNLKACHKLKRIGGMTR